MYLSKIRLWNYRKFGSKSFDIEKPNFELEFNKNLNVLIGENDSGKSAIIDAIKLVLKTHSYETIRVTEEDFYKDFNGNRSERLRIELEFRGFSAEEAKYFTEWLSWENEQGEVKPYLKVNYDVTRTPERILPADVRAGIDKEGSPLSAEARFYLRTTYLKPLRDAENELIAKRNSRLSQILRGHEIFQNEQENYLYKRFKEFNNEIRDYFSPGDKGEIGNDEAHEGNKIKQVIDKFIQGFYSKEHESEFKTPDEEIKNILETLQLKIAGIENPGLGTLNRLFMAAELLHLSKANWNGLKLGLIEELEAHLHPQVQMKVIETLQGRDDIQLILTTHSPNLASKVKLENLIICSNNNAFPMGSKYTELAKENYIFLEKFLDVTKANLFFARGVILVEGWSEQILIPALAKKIGYNLTEYEVSVINIGNTGLENYYRIFLRRNNPNAMGIPVAVVNDLDVREYEKNEEYDKKSKQNVPKVEKNDDYENKCKSKKAEKEKRIINYKSIDGTEKEQNVVRPFISPEWTLEWCLFKSEYFGKVFRYVLKKVHRDLFKDGVNFEEELAYLLIKGGLNKTKIANQLAKEIENGNEYFDESGLKNDVKENKTGEDTISYLIEAIKYVCEN